MNKFLFPAAIIAFSSTLFADESWHTNIENAREIAAREKKSVLVEFTGSDWCGSCIILKSSVLTSPEFKELAGKSLVLVELDFPRKKEIDAAQKEYNNAQAKNFAIEGYPAVFLLDEKGTVFWKRLGAGNKEDYLLSLKSGLENKEIILAALNNAPNATGLEKAKILAKGYTAMTRELQDANPKILEQIAILDPEDTLGITKQKTNRDLGERQIEAFNHFVEEKVGPLAKAKKLEESISLIEKYLNTPDLVPAARQEIYFSLGSFHMRMANLDKAQDVIIKGIEVYPEGKKVMIAKAMLDEFKKNREKIEAEMKKHLN